MKLTILGSGSPEAYDRRASSGYLLEIGSDKILFDVGGGVVGNLLRAGYRPSDITHVFLSHLHSDHMMDYARLVHAAWDAGAPPLKVFAPAPFAQIHDRLFGTDGAFAYDLRARTELPQSQQVWLARGGTLPRPWPAPEITQIDAGFATDHGDWHIRCAPALHAEPLLTCLAFSVQTSKRKFVYSGDTGITDDIRDLARDADLLLHWCYRLDGDAVSPEMARTTPTPSEIAQMANDVGVRCLVLTHFREYMDAAFDPAILQAAPFTNVQTVVAEDLQEFDISVS